MIVVGKKERERERYADALHLCLVLSVADAAEAEGAKGKRVIHTLQEGYLKSFAKQLIDAGLLVDDCWTFRVRSV